MGSAAACIGEVLVIDGRTVEALLPLADCIELMARTMAAVSHGAAELPLRTVMRLPESGNFLGLMPGYLADPAGLGVKIISIFPGNAALGLPSHLGGVIMFEPETGRPVALIDAASVTAIRTAAASAAATRVLARADAGDLAILGAGEQASRHLDAMALVRRLRRVRIWNRSRERAAALAEAAAPRLGLAIEVADSVEQAVAGADLICTTTGAIEPLLHGRWIADGAHINLVGFTVGGPGEVDTDTIARARYFADVRQAALAAAGELKQAIASGRVSEAHLLGEIGEVIAGSISGRTGPDEITIYRSLGSAAQDVAAGTEVYQRAKAAAMGVAAPF
jgi:ornithine cyclodeaminase